MVRLFIDPTRAPMTGSVKQSILPKKESTASSLTLLAMRASQYRPRIARAPAVGLDQRDEALDHLIEQRRLFQIEHVARLGKEGQAGRREMLLQEQTRFDAGVVLVAADDPRRRPGLLDRFSWGVDRGPAAAAGQMRCRLRHSSKSSCYERP